MKVTARYTFDAAHRLHDAHLSPEENDRVFGACSHVHGHTYRLEVTLSGRQIEHGMMLNLNDIDAIVNEHIVERLDHHFIDDLPYFQTIPTTAEELARWVWLELEPLFNDSPGRLEEVTVFEGDRFSATVTRQDALREPEG